MLVIFHFAHDSITIHRSSIVVPHHRSQTKINDTAPSLPLIQQRWWRSFCETLSLAWVILVSLFFFEFSMRKIKITLSLSRFEVCSLCKFMQMYANQLSRDQQVRCGIVWCNQWIRNRSPASFRMASIFLLTIVCQLTQLSYHWQPLPW